MGNFPTLCQRETGPISDARNAILTTDFEMNPKTAGEFLKREAIKKGKNLYSKTL
jgi:hypothetical protein